MILSFYLYLCKLVVGLKSVDDSKVIVYDDFGNEILII